MQTVIAIDIGTSSTKATVVRADGAILATTSADYSLHVEGNRVEQNPQDWQRATMTVLQTLLGQSAAYKPQVVILSGQMQDVVLLNKQGEPLRPAILYSDTRATEEAAIVHAQIGETRLRETTGNLQDASSLLAKLLWIKRHEPAVYANAAQLFIGAHSVVYHHFSGAHVADFTTASTTGLLDLRQNAWATDLLDALELRSDWLPELVTSTDLLAMQGAALSLPLIHGAGDLLTTTLGAGHAGALYGYLGSSGWLAATHHQPVDPETGIFNIRHAELDKFVLVGPMITAAGNVDWLREQFAELDELNAQAAQSPAGSGGLIYLPYLQGERSPFRDPQARGAWIGLGRNTTKGDLYRAVMEGVAFAMRDISEVMPRQPDQAQSLTLTGGGANSALWMQIFADVFGCPVQVLADPSNVGARGAAMLAGRQLGWQTAGHFNIPIAQTFTPNAAHAEIYQRRYPVFKSAYPALKYTYQLSSDVM